MPEGPPPGKEGAGKNEASDEGENNDSDDDIPMPDGSPPIKGIYSSNKCSTC